MVECLDSVFHILYCFYIITLSYRQLNALLLGEETAATLGINIERFRIFIILIVSLLTGVVVAVSGSIGFVGLIVPHIVRMLFGTNYKIVLPLSAIIGAIFIVCADVGARVLIAPEEMPIGIITALFGGPFFIWLFVANVMLWERVSNILQLQQLDFLLRKKNFKEYIAYNQ